MRLRRDAPRPEGRSDQADALALFSVLWALAACWHVVGNATAGPPWAQAAVVGAAGLVLWRPGGPPELALLAATSLVLLWEEAPLLGNHWLLVGLVDVAVLLGVAVSALRRRLHDRIDLADRLLPAARLSLVVFYAFAGFAKLNSAFFDPSVSCAPFFFRESVASLGFDGLAVGSSGWTARALILGTVAVELALPVLLVLRRTRSAGVVLGLVFHSVLALDRTHQFYDFSSVTFALLVLFLPTSAGAWVAERTGSVQARWALRGERVPGLAKALLVAVPVALALAVALGGATARQGLLVGWWPWQLFALVVVGTAVRHQRQAPAREDPTWRLVPHHPAYLVVPLLVVANGLTPYLEVKTAFGWNMYANLRTVDGESNHLLLGRSFPILGEQDDVVTIVRSSDPALDAYADTDYGLVFRQLRAYLQDHPDVSITYDRGGERVTLRQASDLDEVVAPVPLWQEKLQVFRAVDLTAPERCQPYFGAAR